MSKLVGQLERVNLGTGCTDITVNGVRIRAWHTVKGKTGVEFPNPAIAQLEGCKIGDTVEADIFEKGQYKNLNGIAIQTKTDHVPGPSSGDSTVLPVYPISHGGDVERFYETVGAAIYNFIGRVVGKQDSACWAEENHERISAVANAMIEHAYDHFAGLKHTLGQ